MRPSQPTTPARPCPLLGEIAALLTELVDGGATAIVATRDDQLRPGIARGWGLRPGGAPDEFRLCVEAAVESTAARNLAMHAEIAMTLARPSTYRSVQVKGIVLEVAPPDEPDLATARAHQAAVVREVSRVGIGARFARRVTDAGPLIAVTILISELYDQTPRPGAGEPL